MKKIQYFLFVIIILVAGCRKDEIKTDFEFEPTTSGETVQTRFSGQVIDEAGLPIVDAIIKLNGVEKNSNEDGVFSFCLLYTSPSPRDATLSRMPSSA